MLSPQLQIARLALRGEAAVIPANEPWRDWIYSRDAAAGLVAALRAEAPGHRLYHLASGMDWQGSFTQWCEALRQAYPRFSWRRAESGESPNVSFVVERDRAPMDISRIVGDLGFRPRFGPTEAYRDYLGWISGHQAFVADNARESPRQ